MPPEVSTVQPKPQSVLLPVLGALLLGIVLGGAAVWIYVNQGDAKEVQETSPVVSQTPAGWRSYENKEIGVAFEYPASWGEITADGGVGGCFSTDSNYYSAVQLAEMKKDMAGSADPCKEMRLIVSGVSGGIFLSTKTEMYHKYPIPRGGYWGDSYTGSEQELRGYCLSKAAGNACVTNTNSNGVFIVKSHEILGADDEMGWKYLVRSPHSEYASIVLSSSRLDPSWQNDFDRLIDTLHFVQ